MKAGIVPVGNSQDIRIPRPLLEEAVLQDEVELAVEHGSLIVQQARSPRAGWAEAFQEMARKGDDALLDDPPPALSDWDEEWEWECQ